MRKYRPIEVIKKQEEENQITSSLLEVLASRPLKDKGTIVYGDAPKVYRESKLAEEGKAVIKPKEYDEIPGQFSKIFINHFDKNMDRKRELFDMERKAFEDQTKWQQDYEQRLKDGNCTEKDKAMHHLIGLKEGTVQGEYINSDAVPFASREQIEDMIHDEKVALAKFQIKKTLME